MSLPYKNYLLRQLETAGDKIKFWETPTIDYANRLGCNDNSFYECWNFLNKIKDENYSGFGFDPKGKYYTYSKETDELLWFADYKDALIEAGFQAEVLSQEIFMKYRRRKKYDKYLLLPDDIYEIDSLAEGNRIYCKTREIEFSSIEDAAGWLVNSGLAKEKIVALRQLTKHLEGKTAYCYGLKFIKY